MGLMLGKVEGDCMIIQDCLALPVEGTETRVNASSQAYEYMSKFMEDIRSVDRLENAIGWYHSHPGYGCWLSGIDVSTQKLHQQYEGIHLIFAVGRQRWKFFRNILMTPVIQLVIFSYSRLLRSCL